MTPSQALIRQLVQQALDEDLNGLSPSEGDITAQLIPEQQQANADVITREEAIFVAKRLVKEVFAQVDPSVELTFSSPMGIKCDPSSAYLTPKAAPGLFLTAERTALNFVQTLSATATAAYTYSQVLANSNTKLLDTRKTIPGLRALQNTQLNVAAE